MHTRAIYLIFFGITLFAGVLILFPYVNFQPAMSQDDHGRDLYCFKRTMDGGMVYKDYWWIYGPIMPYYYSLFYRAFGVNVRSVLIGQCGLTLLCGALLFLAASVFASPACACIAAIVFWIYYPDFPHTYTFTAGIACFLLAVYSLFLYIRRPRMAPLLLCVGALVLASMVKLNIGASLFCGFLVSVAVADFLTGGEGKFRNRIRLYIGLTALFGAALVIVYLPFTWELPGDIRTQSFPFFNPQRTSTPSLLPSIRSVSEHVAEQFAADRCYWLLLSLVAACFLRSLCLFARNRSLPAPRRDLGAAMLALLLLSLVSSHELVFTRFPLYYQVIWAFPAFFLLCVLAVWIGTSGCGRMVRIGVAALVLVCAVKSHSATTRIVRACKVPSRYLDFKRGMVYVNNPPEWFDAVRGGAGFIMRHVPEKEKIAAFSNDSLYCFLGERDSAIRQQEILARNHPAGEQEREIIATMERQNVRWVVLSNLYRTTEPGKGAGLGLTCCLTLSRYLEEHFGIAAVFGPGPNDPPEWIRGHGVTILRRRETPGRERLFWWGSAKRVATK